MILVKLYKLSTFTFTEIKEYLPEITFCGRKKTMQRSPNFKKPIAIMFFGIGRPFQGMSFNLMIIHKIGVIMSDSFKLNLRP